MKNIEQPKLAIYLFKSVKITKLSDDRFEGNHPNKIFVGTERQGVLLAPIEVGKSVFLNNFYTSTVTEIIDENTFKTLNSTYKIEYLTNGTET